jgi:hypothetical protein
MTVKSMIVWTLRLVALSLLFPILFTICGSIVPMDLPPMEEVNLPAVYRGILLISVVNSLVVILLISTSRWHGFKLVAGLWLAYFGVSAVMAQIETWYFAPALGIARGLAFSILLRDLMLNIIFIPLAVLITGKLKGTSEEESNTRLIMPVSQWAWKLPLIAVAYLILYFSFGQFVAWQNPAVREMYGGGTNMEVFSYWRLIPFQIFRSMLWVLFTLPAIRFMKAAVALHRNCHL